MISYQFKCVVCGHEFEVMQKMNDKNPACPKCQGEVSKQLGAPSIVFRGGGWADEGYHK